MLERCISPRPTQPQAMRAALARALLAIALRDTDDHERAAKVAILRKDGWL